MYYIAVCDDSRDFLNQIHSEVISFFENSGEPFHIDTFDSGAALKNAVIFDMKIWNIIILDIEMPEISGMELAALIRQKSSDAVIIFVTAHQQYAIAAFELSIFRYIPKNMLHDKLQKALSAAIQRLDIQNSRLYFIETSREIFQIPQQDIMYIYREKKYAVLVTKNTSYRVRKSLKKVFEDLDMNYFFFVERGYIVNLAYVQALEGNNLRLKNNESLPIGSSYVQETRERVLAYLKMRAKLL